MTLDIFDSVKIIEIMENYMESTRPEKEIRNEIDLSYSMDGQSVILYEIRPAFMDRLKIDQIPYAKATFVRSKNHWKIYWMRSDLKWHSYSPKPFVKTLKGFLKIVDEDKYACFKG